MIFKMFLDHPHSVDETYLEHMFFAGWFACMLFAAAFAAAVHALLPFCFEKTAGLIIARLYERTKNRGNEPSTAQN